jgi:hypothetical protein
VSTWLVDKVAGALGRRTSRRGFLVRAAIVGSALAAEPVDYILHPGTAYGAVCTCGDPTCSCSSACCDGYTEFCCTLHGSNTCPPGTVAGGWWRADGSGYCGGGPRYYIDCHGECASAATPDAGPVCADDGLECGCAKGSCDHRVAGCVTFRYGQCHQELPRMGRIACRVVTCTPAYLLDNACTTDALYDEMTANHNAPCLQQPAFVRRAYGSATASDAAGVWLVGPDGSVYPTGTAGHFGSMAGRHLDAPIVGMAPARNEQGYWLVASDGGIFAFGSAPFYGSMGGTKLYAPIVGMAASPTGRGYWLVASDGGVFAFGDARFVGSCGNLSLQQPVVAMAATSDGAGYWLLASDGGIFAFGSAGFHGSMGGQALPNLMAGIVPSPSGLGYWLWGEDGSVTAFGDAPDLGDYPRQTDSQRNLPSGGVDAFYAMGTTPDGGYSLWAVSPLGPPPGVRRYDFLSAASPSTTVPRTLLPPLPTLPPL